MKPRSFPELFQVAERHEDYWVAGALLEFTEAVVREMERQGMTRTELAQRLDATPAYVTKILRGKINFSLATMVRLSHALGAGLRVELTPGAGRLALQVTGNTRARPPQVERALKSAGEEPVPAIRVGPLPSDPKSALRGTGRDEDLVGRLRADRRKDRERDPRQREVHGGGRGRPSGRAPGPAPSAVKKCTYPTITGRTLELGGLDEKEGAFLSAVERQYGKQPEWSEFTSWWTSEFRRSGLSEESVACRICQDLEARLGIAQGKVSPPDYRDYLADLIEERYGSCYRFCKESGVDPGHLSRVFASRSELSLQSLDRILEALHAALVIQPEEDLADRLSPERAAEALAAAAR